MSNLLRFTTKYYFILLLSNQTQSDFFDKLEQLSPGNKSFKKSDELKTIGARLEKYHKMISLDIKVAILEDMISEMKEYITKQARERAKNKLSSSLLDPIIKFVAQHLSSVMKKESYFLDDYLSQRRTPLENNALELDDKKQELRDKLSSVLHRKNQEPEEQSREAREIQKKLDTIGLNLESTIEKVNLIRGIQDRVMGLSSELDKLKNAGKNDEPLWEYIKDYVKEQKENEE